MRAALLALTIACGTAEALKSAQPLAAPPWYGSPCASPADCVPAGQTPPVGVFCASVNSGGERLCQGGKLACEVFADGGASACGPGACCWGPTEYNTDGGGLHYVPGAGECSSATLPGYCSHVRQP